MVIVPTMQISWTLFSIVSGGIYYQEYKGYTTLKSVMFAVGVAVRACPAWPVHGCLHASCLPAHSRLGLQLSLAAYSRAEAVCVSALSASEQREPLPKPCPLPFHS